MSQATAAELDSPQGVAVDSAGDIFIADYYNDRIREVNAYDALITTIAGNGSRATTATASTPPPLNFRFPEGVAAGLRRGPLHRRPASTTVSARSTPRRADCHGLRQRPFGYNGDNVQATAAELANPVGVAVDSAGDIFIADTDNNRIREVNATRT